MLKEMFQAWLQIHTPINSSWMALVVVVVFVICELMLTGIIVVGILHLVDYLFSKRGESAGIVTQKNISCRRAHTSFVMAGKVLVPIHCPAHTSYCLLIRISDGTSGWFYTSQQFFESIAETQNVYVNYSRGRILGTVYINSLQVT